MDSHFFMLWSPFQRFMQPMTYDTQEQVEQAALEYCRTHAGADVYILQALRKVTIGGDPRQIRELA